MFREFTFTRTLEQDYHISSGEVLYPEAVSLLQDYFGSLIDNVGACSYAWEDVWIVATIIRTEEKDRVDRPIYLIQGYECQLENSLAAFCFVECAVGETVRFLPALEGKEIGGSLEVLRGFLDYARTLRQPVSWAYGVSSKDCDVSGIHFQYRFIQAEFIKKSFLEKVLSFSRILTTKTQEA